MYVTKMIMYEYVHTYNYSIIIFCKLINNTLYNTLAKVTISIHYIYTFRNNLSDIFL